MKNHRNFFCQILFFQHSKNFVLSFLDFISKITYNLNMEKFLCVDRVAFSIGSFDIYWYGIMICAAIIVAILVATLFCKIRKYEIDTPINIALVILPAGILFGRLFSVIFEPELSLADFFNFRTGGMSIIGAIIGGAIAIIAYALIKKEKDI